MCAYMTISELNAIDEERARQEFRLEGERRTVLILGGSQDLMSKQLLLRQAFKMGVTYWDTANTYMGGNSEKAIGKYLSKFPEDREKLFIVTKAQTSDPDGLTEKLHGSLERLQTDYVDIFLLHRDDPSLPVGPSIFPPS